MTKVNNFSAANIPQNIPSRQTAPKQDTAGTKSCSQEKNADAFEESAEPKDWTIFCYARTEKELKESFKRSIPEELRHFNLNGMANILTAFGKNEKTANIYNASLKGKYIEYKSEVLKGTAKTSRNGERLSPYDLMISAMSKFPAKNYIFILPKPESEKLSQESFYYGLANSPQIQKLLEKHDNNAQKIEMLQGFDAFQISMTDEKNERGNIAKFMAQAAYKVVGSASPDGISPGNNEVKAYFDKESKKDLYDSYVKNIKKEKILSREFVQESGIDMPGIVCLRHYTSEGYKEINKALRDNNSKDLKELKPLMDPIIDSMKKLPAYEGKTYRFTDMPNELIKKHKPGAEINYNSFLSSSKYDNWSSGSPFRGNVFLTIESTSQGKDVSWASEYPHEDEILFPPETNFTVISKKKKDGKYYIHLRENIPAGNKNK